MMIADDDTLHDRATSALARRAAREGALFRQPAEALTEVTWRRDGTALVVLRNSYDELGRFLWTGRRMVAA